MKAYILTLPVIAVVVVLFLFSCLASNKYESRGIEKDCKPYYDYVKKNFVKTDEGIFEFLNPPKYDTSLQIIFAHTNEPCIVGLTKRQVIRIFGEPSFKSDSSFHYYHRKECLKAGEPKPGCARLKIIFDGSNRVEEVRIPILETLPIPNEKKQ